MRLTSDKLQSFYNLTMFAERMQTKTIVLMIALDGEFGKDFF